MWEIWKNEKNLPDREEYINERRKQENEKFMKMFAA